VLGTLGTSLLAERVAWRRSTKDLNVSTKDLNVWAGHAIARHLGRSERLEHRGTQSVPWFSGPGTVASGQVEDSLMKHQTDLGRDGFS